MLCTFRAGDFYRIPDKSPKLDGGQNEQSMQVK